MSIITNTYRTALGLPGGIILQPNTPTPVRGWEAIRDHSAVVRAWLRAGILKESDTALEVEVKVEAQESRFLPPDKAELQTKLDALGVKYDKRSGVAKLQALLEEANDGATVVVFEG